MIKKFFENTTILSATEILLCLKGLILIPLLTKTFGPTNYGIWAQVAVLIALITPVIIMGTDSALMVYIPGKEQKYIQKAFWTAIFYISIISFVFLILLTFFSQSLSLFFLDSPENAKFIILAGFSILIGVLFSFGKLWYRIQNDAKKYSTITIVDSFSATLAALIIVILNGDIFQLLVITVFMQVFITHNNINRYFKSNCNH